MQSGLRPACLTLYWPPIWRATSWESQTSSSSRTPSSSATRVPSRRARYSATLFVASPMNSLRSASASPASSYATAAMPAGPGFPRAPPSTWTTSLPIPSLTARGAREVARRRCRGRRDAERGSRDRLGGEAETAGVVGGRVPAAQNLVEVVDLVAAVEQQDRLVGVVEVDAVAVPRELPGDHDAHLARRRGVAHG